MAQSDHRITARLPWRERLSVVPRQVAEFTAGETFAAAWEAALRLSHTEFRALLTGEPGRLQVIDGEVQIRFAPFADAVTSRLVGAGVPLIDRLPTVTGGLTVLRVDPRLLPALQAGYRVLSTLAGWLPLLALSASIAALWVWPRKRPAMIGVGLALAVGAIAVCWCSVGRWRGTLRTAGRGGRPSPPRSPVSPQRSRIVPLSGVLG